MSTSSERPGRFPRVLGFAVLQAAALVLAGLLPLVMYGPWARGGRAATAAAPRAAEPAAAAMSPSRIADCSRELQRHADDPAGRGERLRKQLFEGRCAGHPDARDERASAGS